MTTPEVTKKCVRCGAVKPIAEFYTIKNRERYRPHSYCKRCTREINAARRTEPRESTSLRAKKWREGNWARNLFTSLSAGARSRGLHVLITTQTINDLWESQAGRCALTGLEMTRTYGMGPVQTNASVDRIDSFREYSLDNVQLVCVVVNRMKLALSVKDFRHYCQLVASYVATPSTD